MVKRHKEKNQGFLCPSFFSKTRKGQVGIEYMVVVGFVSFAIIAVISLAFVYSGEIKDSIRLNQVESFAGQLVNSAEAVFFAGEPSKSTIKLYLPDGVESIEINSNSVFITTRVSGALNKRAFDSKVPMQGSISSGEGLKKLSIEAFSDYVSITQVAS